MTTTPGLQASSSHRSRWRAAVAAFLPAFLLSLLATAITSAVLGVSLGLFFGGIFVCALMLPPMVLAEESGATGMLAAAGAWLGVSLVWLEVTFRGHLPGYAYPDVADALACIVVAGSFVLSLAAMALMLRYAGLPRALASFLTIFVALAWLAWPVWASPWLGGHDRLVALLVAPHPMLAINSVLQHLGLWNQQPLAYNLTVLNQDAYLPLPRSIVPAVVVHTVIGAVCLGPVMRGRGKGWWGWRFAVVGKHAAAEQGAATTAPAEQGPSPLPSPLSTGERG